MEKFKLILNRLKKPSVILSIVSQIISILIIMGVKVDNNVIMTAATGICAIFVTLGIMSNPDTEKTGYGDDVLLCSNTGKPERHVMVNGQMVCQNCGAIYNEQKEETTKTEE